MKVKIQVIIESEGETEVVQEVAGWERDTLQPETLGLMLAEAKSLLQGVQQTMVRHQVSAYLQQQSVCPDCGQKRLRKGDRSMTYRTLFGKLRLRSSRLFHCKCQSHATRTFNPLANLLAQQTSRLAVVFRIQICLADVLRANCQAFSRCTADGKRTECGDSAKSCASGCSEDV